MLCQPSSKSDQVSPRSQAGLHFRQPPCSKRSDDAVSPSHPTCLSTGSTATEWLIMPWPIIGKNDLSVMVENYNHDSWWIIMVDTCWYLRIMTLLMAQNVEFWSQSANRWPRLCQAMSLRARVAGCFSSTSWPHDETHGETHDETHGQLWLMINDQLIWLLTNGVWWNDYCN